MSWSARWTKLTILGIEVEILIKDAATVLLADRLSPACVDLLTHAVSTKRAIDLPRQRSYQLFLQVALVSLPF